MNASTRAVLADNPDVGSQEKRVVDHVDVLCMTFFEGPQSPSFTEHVSCSILALRAKVGSVDVNDLHRHHTVGRNMFAMNHILVTYLVLNSRCGTRQALDPERPSH